jgi:hypothetical protein
MICQAELTMARKGVKLELSPDHMFHLRLTPLPHESSAFSLPPNQTRLEPIAAGPSQIKQGFGSRLCLDADTPFSLPACTWSP